MPLTKPSQALYRDLKESSFNIEGACADLGRVASRLSGTDALELMKVIGRLYGEVDRLAACAGEVEVGAITERRLSDLDRQPFQGERVELANPNQELCSSLKEAAALLKWAMQMVEQLSETGFKSDAKELMAIISEFPDTESELVAYAKEMNSDQVTRAKPE